MINILNISLNLQINCVISLFFNFELEYIISNFRFYEYFNKYFTNQYLKNIMKFTD